MFRPVLIATLAAVLLASCAAHSPAAPPAAADPHAGHTMAGMGMPAAAVPAGATFNRDTAGLPAAAPTRRFVLADGATFRLTAAPVLGEIAGQKLRLLGWNGSVPGPTLVVQQGSQIKIEMENKLDLPLTLHPHGLRGTVAADGMPGLSQPEVQPGAVFTHDLTFPDAGVFWYHPHVRQDYAQEMGLYGQIVVLPKDANYWNPVNLEDYLLLDDIQLDAGGVTPFARDYTQNALMGRGGAQLLVNGKTSYTATLSAGSVARFFLTNAANARTFSFGLPGVKMKIVGDDIGRSTHETWAESVVVAPGERVAVEAFFQQAGDFAVQVAGQKMGELRVTEATAAPDYRASFQILRTDAALEVALQNAQKELREKGTEKSLNMRAVAVPVSTTAPADTNKNVAWQLVDSATGRPAETANWTFKKGQQLRLHVANDLPSLHMPFAHPLHLHGQRFLLLAQNGQPVADAGWQDTVAVPGRGSVDLLVEFTNPGDWMAHCHIAEHAESGMMFTFRVQP